MKHSPRHSSGFTLVEMIIVLTVVVIIGMMAVSTYSGSRRQARLDIAVDRFISALREQSGKAKNGQLLPFDEVRDQNNQQYLRPACYGLVAAAGDGNPMEVQAAPYVALARDGNADVCDFLTTRTFPSEFFEELEIKKLRTNDQLDHRQLKLFYKPPFSKMVVADESGVLKEVKTVDIVFGSKNMAQDKTQRCVQINILNNVISRECSP